MKRDVKRLGIFTTALVCAGFAGAGLLSSQSLQAKAESNVQMVEMGYGAALRLGDNFGMRFQMNVNQEWLDAEAQQGAKVRMLLIREDKLTGELTKDTAGVYGTGETQVLTNRSDVGDEYQYNAVIVDIPDYAYDEAIVARGAVELPTGEYVYTDLETIQVRSVAQVANAALTDKFDDYYMDIGKYLVREIEVEETKYVGVGATGSVDAWLDYFVNATAAVQQQFNAKTAFAFESSDPAVVEVDEETGAFTAISGGTATVTVSAWGKTATCEITVDGNAQYKSDYTVTFPSLTESEITTAKTQTPKINGTGYSWGNSASLGDGLLIDMKGNSNGTAVWQYPYAINFAGKTSADPIIDLLAIPTVAMARECGAIKVTFTDTENASNTVTVRVQRNNVNNPYCHLTVTHSAAGNVWVGYVNATNSPSGTLTCADTNGTRNLYISFDYANRAVYSMGYDQGGLCVLADLDDDFYFNSANNIAHWNGFTNDTAYVSVVVEGINTADKSTGVFVRTIADYGLADSDAQVTAKYTTNNVKDDRTTVDEDDIADEGLLLTLNEGGVFTAKNLTVKGGTMYFKVKPTAVGTADFNTLWIKIKDTASDKCVIMKIQTGASIHTGYAHASYFTLYHDGVLHTNQQLIGTSNFAGIITENSGNTGYIGNNTYRIFDYANNMWANNLYFNHYQKQIDGWLNGIETADVSIWAEDYTGDAPAQLFITSLFGADLTSYK